jgi:CheY-like chemotaxis protein
VRAHDAGLEFICAAAPNVPTYLTGDPGRLRQILHNLAGNAVKFTQHGEVAVRVGLESETETEATLRFSVKDTGIGIPPDKHSMLFQKFTQADTSTTRKYGGTGLGLAISKQLAELMGGEIGLNSEDGVGSEFWFTARFGKPSSPAQRVVPAGEIRGVRILVVDDNTTNREVLTSQLGAWGVRSAEAPDGPAALDIVRRAQRANDPFTAAILDLQMPKMDGATLARAFRADKTTAAMRLVLMTSLGARGNKRELEEIGFAASMAKPIRQCDLLHCLAAVVGDPGSECSGRADSAAPIEPSAGGGTLSWRHARVLLVEDNITNQQVALAILNKLGVHAEAVADGVEALQSLETIPYDLVLMDGQMPEMDGFEATRRIRDPGSTVLNRDIPIIAMTANALGEDRERCLEAGMNDYVTKPVFPNALSAALQRWLPRR